jgi:hypothetical protein
VGAFKELQDAPEVLYMFACCTDTSACCICNVNAAHAAAVLLVLLLGL